MATCLGIKKYGAKYIHLSFSIVNQQKQKSNGEL